MTEVFHPGDVAFDLLNCCAVRILGRNDPLVELRYYEVENITDTGDIEHYAVNPGRLRKIN